MSNQMAERRGAVAARDAKNQLLGTKMQIDAADYANKVNLVQNQQMAMAQGAGQFLGGVGGVFSDYLLGTDYKDGSFLDVLARGTKRRLNAGNNSVSMYESDNDGSGYNWTNMS